jgi:hypothetical protein
MEFQFSAKFSLERILELEKLLFEDPYGVWRIFACFVIILVSFFWSQIFLRGLIFRSYKFEYFVFLITITFLTYINLTYGIWPDANTIISVIINGFFCIGLYKAWEWLTKPTSWGNFEKNMGPDSFKNLSQSNAFSNLNKKNSVGRSIEKHGLSKAYYMFWAGFLSFIGLLAFTLLNSQT